MSSDDSGNSQVSWPLSSDDSKIEVEVVKDVDDDYNIFYIQMSAGLCPANSLLIDRPDDSSDIDN